MGNRHVVMRMFDEVINLGKVDLIDDLFDPEFSSETPQGTFDRDGFREYVTSWLAGFPDIHCEVNDVVESGDAVAWRIRARGTNSGDFMGIPATGKSIDFDSLNIGWFKDGRGYRHKMVMDTAEVMAQLGLMPQPKAPARVGVGLVMSFEGIGREEYEAAMSAANLDLSSPLNTDASGLWPRGIVAHYAGATPSGWCVIDVWQSQDAFDDFLLNRLGPVLAKVGIPEPNVTPFALYNSHIA
jgi:predicted ester cyclase